MSWEERLKEAAYVSPSGERLVFMYEDVSRTFDKKTAGFDFPDAEGTLVQDSGSTGYKYPILAYFSGADCDLEADRFELALRETGRGRLEHPIYGTVDVVPFGAVTRSDALKTAANQSTVEVTFWETILPVYPMPQTDPASQVLQEVRDLAGVLGGDLSQQIDLSDPGALATFKNKMTSIVKTVEATLSKINGAKELVTSKISEVIATVDGIVSPTLGALEGVRSSVVSLVDQVMELAAVPGDLAAPFREKFVAYQDLIKSLIEPIFEVEDETEFLAEECFAECLLGGTLVSVVDSAPETQGEALQNAADILELLEDITTWIEDTRGRLELVDASASYQRLQEATAMAAEFLVSSSFNLKKERVIVLERPRTIIDLSAQIYGSVDDMLDTLIDTNHLSGSEILELPMGKEIKYYV